MTNKFDPYTLLKMVSETNMACVYEAVKEDHKYGIKHARLTDNADPSINSKFNQDAIVNEVEWLEQLQGHPGIVPLLPIEKAIVGKKIYRAHANLPGQPWYFIMEFIPDGSLRNLINERKKLGVKLSLHILLSIAKTLMYIHGKQGIHRDLKPSNVMFRKKPDTDQLTNETMPILIDFGLTAQINSVKSCPGTPDWMAPECRRANVKRERIIQHPAMDIYPLGLMFYAMLTGVTPEANAEYLHPHVRVSAAMFADDPSIPVAQQGMLVEKINEILAQLLQADPAARPTAAAVVKQLGDLLTLVEAQTEQTVVMPIKQNRPVLQHMSNLFRAEAHRSPGQIAMASAVVLLATLIIWATVDIGFPPFPVRALSTVTPVEAPTPTLTATVAAPALATTQLVTNDSGIVTEAVAPTPMATPTPTATAIEVVATTVTAGSVVIFTATATPTIAQEPTASVTPTATATATATEEPTSTPIPTPSATATPTTTPSQIPLPPRRIPAVTLIDPPLTSSDPVVPFTWQADGALAPNHCFQLVFWEAGGDPLRFNQSVVLTGADKRTAVNIKFGEAERNGAIKSGVAYNVGVLVINCNPPYQRLRLASNVHVFTYHAP